MKKNRFINNCRLISEENKIKRRIIFHLSRTPLLLLRTLHLLLMISYHSSSCSHLESLIKSNLQAHCADTDGIG